jgi:hypothetical protein
MGHYIQTGMNLGKADFLIKNEHATEITQQEASCLVKSGGEEGVVVVVSNVIFEAAAYAYDIAEFNALTNPGDNRARRFIKMNKNRIHELTGYS